MESPFVGDSEMARRMREVEWAGTPLGPPHRWPAALRTAVGLLLRSQLPMYIAAGPGVGAALQRRLRPDARCPAPAGAGGALRDHLARGVAGPAAGAGRRAGGQGGLPGGPADAAGPPGLAGGDLVHLLPQRRRCGGVGRGRGVLRVHRDHRPGDRRAAAARAGRARRAGQRHQRGGGGRRRGRRARALPRRRARRDAVPLRRPARPGPSGGRRGRRAGRAPRAGERGRRRLLGPRPARGDWRPAAARSSPAWPARCPTGGSAAPARCVRGCSAATGTTRRRSTPPSSCPSAPAPTGPPACSSPG